MEDGMDWLEGFRRMDWLDADIGHLTTSMYAEEIIEEEGYESYCDRLTKTLEEKDELMVELLTSLPPVGELLVIDGIPPILRTGRREWMLNDKFMDFYVMAATVRFLSERTK